MMIPPKFTAHSNKSYKMAGGGFVPAFLGSAAQAYGDQKNEGAAMGANNPQLGGIGDEDEDDKKPQAGPYAPNSPGRMGSNR